MRAFSPSWSRRARERMGMQPGVPPSTCLDASRERQVRERACKLEGVARYLPLYFCLYVCMQVRAGMHCRDCAWGAHYAATKAFRQGSRESQVPTTIVQCPSAHYLCVCRIAMNSVHARAETCVYRYHRIELGAPICRH